MASTFDTLEIAKRLKSAGFGDAQAEAITGALRETRDADLSRLATREEMNAGFAALRAEMEILRRDLTIRLGGMIVVATGVLLAAKFFG
jgi:hypothetical protein